MSCFRFGEILLPAHADVSDWAVVACDQYTSNRAYWERLYQTLKKPTALDMILPEAYLTAPDVGERLQRVIAAQHESHKAGIFEEIEGTVVVKRTTRYGNTHYGLMLLVDLEQYSIERGAKPLIRATEAVVPERIPPRVKIRKACPVELPHIMVLYDDPNDTVLAPYKADSGEVLYHGTLNSGGGTVTGFRADDAARLTNALHALQTDSEARYGEPLLFLVGDGNHSLATAKACMDAANPRSRYALVEAVNIYDPGILFEPIHRVITGVDPAHVLQAYRSSITGGETTVYIGKRKETAPLPLDAIEGVRAVDAFLTEYVSQFGGEVDYIHGEDELQAAAANGGVGIVLKKMDKSGLFPYIVRNGPLPKKTFSMGEADEKRYYLEARYII